MASTYSAAAGTMIRVIGALLLRETRVRFGKTQIGYLWAILEPLAGVLVFATMFGFIGRQPGAGNSLLLYFAISILGFNIYRKVSASVGSALLANAALLGYPIVKPVDALLARALLETATGFVTIAVMLGGLLLIEDAPLPAKFDVLLAGYLALALIGFGIGSINAVISQYSSSWQQIEGLLQRPLFLLSGVFFTPDHFPSEILAWLSWNPLMHAIEWLRYGYYEGYRGDFIDYGYVIGWGLGSALIGLAAQRYLPRGEDV
jgi:capsular polysaccharide transport system permease protein